MVSKISEPLRYCRACGCQLPMNSRADKEFCGGACEQYARRNDRDGQAARGMSVVDPPPPLIGRAAFEALAAGPTIVGDHWWDRFRYLQTHYPTVIEAFGLPVWHTRARLGGIVRNSKGICGWCLARSTAVRINAAMPVDDYVVKKILGSPCPRCVGEMAAEKRERQQAKAAKSAATTTTTARTTSLRVQPIHNADECWSPCHQALTAGANRATVEASGKQHKPNPPTARNWCPDRDSCTASINGDHR